jgi:predicted amidohydrolase
VKLALVQLGIEHADVETNVASAEAAIATAATKGADLVALPEIFNVGYFAFDAYQRNAEGLEGPTLTRIADAAATHGVGVLAGSIVEDLAETTTAETPAEEGLANTSVLFDRDGERLAVYRKHHLFGYQSAEARLLVPGERIAVTDFEAFSVGMTTCYDLRFPELYRSIAEQGATLVLVPSAWPYPRVEHWQTLTRARAIENQLYVATINGSGSFDDATLLGRSSVYDPWGTLLASTDDDPDVVYAEIDPGRVEAVREEFPAWGDRRS